ncbi:MAG: toprim domain-containing protein, partial [Methylococcaceae bacterium]
NANNELVNLQFIDADGVKRFLAGGKKSGCFWWIGQKSEKILIAEGFATAASIHDDTGHLTIIAFDAGNLEPVAQVIRQRNPKTEMIIMADNDISGIGQSRARLAALATNCKYIVCPVSGMDFNDYLNKAA